jgi:hypothetical protein
MKGARQTISFLIIFLLLGTPVITCAEEPLGLILRKGSIVWKSTLQQARNFIEEDMRPNRPLRMKTFRPKDSGDDTEKDTEKDDRKFSCEKTDSPSVLRCNLACCVDFGEGKTLRFATLYFYGDQFYQYKIAFPLDLYQKIAEANKQKYGKPTKSEESVMTNLRGDRFNNLVEQWKLENTLVVLGSRGGEGKIFLSHLDVYYLPIYRQVLETQPKTKLPY